MDPILNPIAFRAKAPERSLAAEREGVRGLRATIELAPVGIAHFDLEGRFLFVNARLCAILGYARDELLGRTFASITWPDDLARCVELTTQLAAGAIESYVHDKRFVARDGRPVWTRVTVAAVRDDDGSIAFFVGVAEDSSKQHGEEDARLAAEAAARARESEFRALANSIPQMVWIATSDGRRSWFNDRWYEYTGLAPERLLDHGWHRVHHPDHLERVRDAQLAAFARDAAWEDTFPLRAADGSYRWFLSRAVPMRDENGAVVRWFGSNTDITEARLAEQAVRASEARLRRIVDSGIIGVFYAHGDGSVTAANDSLLAMLRYERADVEAGLLDWRTLTHESSGTLESACCGRAGTPAMPPREAAFYASDGRIVPVLLAAAQLDAEPDCCVAVCVDITRRKAAELERERLFVLERDARLEAERASRARDEMLAIAAHDLRNPLHTIAMNAALMLRFELPPEQRTHQLEVVQRTAKSMERLLGDFLDVSRIEAGSFAVMHEPVDLGPLLLHLREEFEPLAQARGLHFGIETDSTATGLVGDRDRLMQVLSNLLGNAFKFTPAPGEVILRVQPDGASVKFTVTDTGPGIAADHLPLLFERHWQADRRARDGAGLGLPIVKGIIEAHAGRVWAESAHGHGAAFHFTVPRAPA